MAGAVLAAGRLAGQSDPFGLLPVVFVMATAYYGGIAAGLIWLPILAWCRLGQPSEERSPISVLVPAALLFGLALIPIGFAVAKHSRAQLLERRTLQALNAAPSTVSPWARIDTRLPAVAGQVIQWLERTPTVPAWKLEEIAATFPDNNWLAVRLARQKECPLSLLETLWDRTAAWRKKEDLRTLEMALVTHPACDEALLKRILQGDSYPETRDAIVARFGPERSDIANEALRLSAENEDFSTRAVAAKNPRLPRSLMEKLADDPRTVVRATLATNPALPFELLEKLNRDAEVEVRHQVILHPAAQAEWKSAFYRDAVTAKSTDIRYSVVSEDPDISPETLATLAGDESWGIRQAVADHPKTSREVLEQLASDSDNIVRTAAKSRLSERAKPN